MDFVYEQHVAFLEVGEQPGEVGGLFDGRTAGGFEVRAHRPGNDIGKGGFAEAGRSVEQDMVERLAALAGGGDGDLEPFLDLRLAGEFGKERRPQRQFQRHVRFVQSRNRSLRHRAREWGKGP